MLSYIVLVFLHHFRKFSVITSITRIAFCSYYVFSYRNAHQDKSRHHSISSLKFVRLFVRRYFRGIGSIVKLSQPTYISQKHLSYQAEFHSRRLNQSLSGCAWLYLADVFKVQGCFDDAKWIYHRLYENEKMCDLAHAGMGDLLLVEAIWAREFREYDAAGGVLNMHRIFGTTATGTWHEASFQSAIEILQNAALLNPSSVDIAWLLVSAHTEAGNWQAAYNCFETYKKIHRPHSEHDYFQIKALFGINPDADPAMCRKTLGGWYGWYRVTRATILEPEQASNAPGISHRTLGEAISSRIGSTLIYNNEIKDFETTIIFEAPSVLTYDVAEVLPRYGMIYANDRNLIASSLHIQRSDWHLFTPQIKGLTDNKALLAGIRPLDFPDPGCIYIGSNDNYYHSLIEDLPRLLLLEKNEEYRKSPLLVDYTWPNWYQEFVWRLGVDVERIRCVDFSKPIRFKQLIAPSHLSRNMVTHPEGVQLIRSRLAPDANNKKPKHGKRLYLARKSSLIRKTNMLYEARLSSILENAGFITIDPGKMSIGQQIELFSDAEIIAGPGGAAMTNILFAPIDAKVLIFSSIDASATTYVSLAQAIGQKLTWCMGAGFCSPDPAWIWTSFDFEIAQKDVKLALEHIL